MSLIKIADAIGIVKEITDLNSRHVRSVGASIFVGTDLTERERELITIELDPQEIKQLDGKVARVDL